MSSAARKKASEPKRARRGRPQLDLFEEKAAAPPSAAEPARAVKASRRPPARRATAESMAQKQREISVSEFFVKNRHLLGFDNPSKALLTTIKEAVDNSLDACEEAGILPELHLEVHDLGLGGKTRSRS